MRLGIIPSGSNLTSVCAAFERLGACCEFVTTPEAMNATDRLILPGVGAASAAMRYLGELGLVEALRAYRRPLLGICIGMQLLFEASEEGAQSGDPVPMLGRLPGLVTALKGAPGVRLPHMGWNRLDYGSHVYFVHSFRVPDGPWTTARATHGDTFPAQIAWGNLHGVQFHPEKSGDAGARVLREFLQAAEVP